MLAPASTPPLPRVILTVTHSDADPPRRRGAVARTEVTFESGDAWCAGWLYRPTDSGEDIPCVVMAHGFSLTRHDGLASYAETLAAAGTAVLVYDHRRIGDSGGQPRQLIRLRPQLEDRRSAIAHARSIPGIDPDRIVVWGYSLSGGSAVQAAATDPRLAGAILMCPMLDGALRTFNTLKSDPRNIALLIMQSVRDWIGSTHIPVTGPSGMHSMLSLPGEADGLSSMIGAGSPWRKDVRAGPFLTWALHRPVRNAHKVACPVLIQIGRRDISAPVRAAQRFAARSQRTTLDSYDVDHFEPFSEPVAAEMAADQAAWLTRTVIAAGAAGSTE